MAEVNFVVSGGRDVEYFGAITMTQNSAISRPVFQDLLSAGW